MDWVSCTGGTMAAEESAATPGDATPATTSGPGAAGTVVVGLCGGVALVIVVLTLAAPPVTLAALLFCVFAECAMQVRRVLQGWTQLRRHIGNLDRRRRLLLAGCNTIMGLIAAGGMVWFGVTANASLESPVLRCLVWLPHALVFLVWMVGRPRRTKLKIRAGVPESMRDGGAVHTWFRALRQVTGHAFFEYLVRIKRGEPYNGLIVAAALLMAIASTAFLFDVRLDVAKALDRAGVPLVEPAEGAATAAEAPATLSKGTTSKGTTSTGETARERELTELACADATRKLLGTRVPEKVGVALVDAWGFEGSPAVGCASAPPFRVGLLYAAHLDGGRAGRSLVISDEKGIAGVLIGAQAVDLMKGKLDRIAWVTPRKPFGLGRYHVVSYSNDGCALLVYWFPSRALIEMPPAVANSAIPFALDLGGMPKPAGSEHKDGSLTYSFTVAQLEFRDGRRSERRLSQPREWVQLGRHGELQGASFDSVAEPDWCATRLPALHDLAATLESIDQHAAAVRRGAARSMQ